MTRRVRAYEMVTPRRPSMLVPAGVRWKVTARYTLAIGRGRCIPCVRVHCFSGTGFVLHFSEQEFNRQFKPEKP